jgi:uncharacterized protein (DUF1778 family)
MTIKTREQKTRRLDIRVTPEIRSLLERAANVQGCTLSDFVRNAVRSSAEEVIRSRQILQLSARDSDAFFAALENPPTFDPTMKNAVRCYRAAVQVVR